MGKALATKVLGPQVHIKLDMVGRICNHSAPVVRWEGEIDSLEACEPFSLCTQR